MNLLAVLLAAALAATDTPAPEITNVRFPSPRLLVARAKSGGAAFVKGPLRVDLSFRRASARKPVLRIFCLCEEEGALVCRRGLWAKPHAYARLGRSEILAAFKASGFELPAKEREKAMNDPALVSRYLPSVAKEAYAAAAYGSSAANEGFFRFEKSASVPRLLLFRLELWQNGVLTAHHESSRTALGRDAVPADWHVWGKYPEKFRYEERSY